MTESDGQSEDTRENPSTGTPTDAPQEAPTPRGRRRRRPRTRPRRTGTAAVVRSDGLLALLLLGSVLPLGSVHVPIFLAVAVVAMITGAVSLLGAGRLRGALPGVAVVLASVSAYTALQAIPIPMGVLRHMSPTAADVWSRALLPFAEGAPRLASLSLDPGASWVEALKWWTYAATFVSASAFGARHGVKWGAILMLGVAVVVALATIGHGAFNATRVFGIYRPTLGGHGWGVGPLINANTLAGYLNLGLFAGIGLVASAETPLPRWLLAIAAATVLGVSVNTGSRGGFASILVGFVLLVPLLREARTHEGVLSKRDRMYLIGGLASAIGAGAIFAVVAATSRTIHLLGDENLRKLRMFLWAPPMMRDYPWFGVGRGAFEGVFPAYKMAENNSIFTHPENFLIQWATEWGLPVACALVVMFAWLLRPKAWGAGKSAAASGLFAGFAALAVQNIVDLGLELPGVAIGACVTAGVALGGRLGPREPEEPRVLGPRILAGACVLVGLALFAPAALIGTHTLTEDKNLAASSYPGALATPDDRAAFKDVLHGAMARHPADPYFPREGALLAMSNHGENPVPWAERALERAPSSGRTHYLIAALLGRHRIRLQALLELRYAVEQDQDLAGRAARLAIRLTRHHDDLLRIVPDGPEGAIELSALAGTLRHVDQQASFEFYEEAIKRNPHSLGARFEITRMLIEALRDRRLGTRCTEEHRITCEKVALEQIRALAQALPLDDAPLDLAGRLLMVAGRPKQAAALLSSLCPTLPKRSKCTPSWIEAAAETSDAEEFTRAIRFAERDGCSAPKACGATYTVIGNIISRVSGPFAALPYYRRAVSEDPSKANWMRVAAVAALIGAHGEASGALDHAAAFGEATPELRESQERERSRAMSEALKIH